MAHLRERREELLCAADKLFREQFVKSIRSLEEFYAGAEYRREAAEAFAGLARQWKEQSGERKKAACLGICCLYNSVLRRDYRFKLILMGEEFWLDEEPAEADWNPPGFSRCFAKDMEAVMEKLQGMFVRMCRSEEDAVWQWCAEYYFAAAGRLCMDMAEEIAEGMGLEEMARTKGFYFFFGHYRGEGEIIWREKPGEVQDA